MPKRVRFLGRGNRLFLGGESCGKKSRCHTYNDKNQEEMKISNTITGLSACENGQPMINFNGQGDYEEVGNSTPEVSDGEVVQHNDGNSGKTDAQFESGKTKTEANNGCQGKSFIRIASETAFVCGILAIAFGAFYQSGFKIRMKNF